MSPLGVPTLHGPLHVPGAFAKTPGSLSACITDAQCSSRASPKEAANMCPDLWRRQVRLREFEDWCPRAELGH